MKSTKKNVNRVLDDQISFNSTFAPLVTASSLLIHSTLHQLDALIIQTSLIYVDESNVTRDTVVSAKANVFLTNNSLIYWTKFERIFVMTKLTFIDKQNYRSVFHWFKEIDFDQIPINLGNKRIKLIKRKTIGSFR